MKNILNIRGRSKRIMSVFLLLNFCLFLSGCSKDEPLTDKDMVNPSESVQDYTTVGKTFLTTGLKIKATVQDLSVTPARSMLFEVYVDSNNNGYGMAGYGENVFPVDISNGRVFITVGDTVIRLLDITSRFIFESLDLSSAEDLTFYGFTLSDNTITKYSAEEDDVNISALYAQSDSSFEAKNMAATAEFNLSGLINSIIDYTSGALSGNPKDEETPSVKDFYVNSPYGVKIGDKVYSIGDTCNVDTYFGLRPEGLLISSEYKEDQRIDYRHVSYISETGRTVFVLSGDYVQAIETTASFTFLGLSRGADYTTLKAVVGYQLSADQEEKYKPPIAGFVCEEYSDSRFICTVKGVRVELRCDNSGTLQSLYLEKSNA